jgi:uncharacterized protein YqgC (DUF456 family)
MEIALLVVAFIFLVLGLLGAVVPVLPGPPLGYVGILLLHKSGYASFSMVFLLIWAGIAVAVTVMDYFLPSILAKKFGGSKAAAIGAFLGLLAGIFFFPPFGFIVGSFFGAFFGELIHINNEKAQRRLEERTEDETGQSDERNDDTPYENAPEGKALKVAFGAFLAFIAGSGAKLIVGAMLIFYAVKSMV